MSLSPQGIFFLPQCGTKANQGTAGLFLVELAPAAPSIDTFRLPSLFIPPSLRPEDLNHGSQLRKRIYGAECAYYAEGVHRRMRIFSIVAFFFPPCGLLPIGWKEGKPMQQAWPGEARLAGRHSCCACVRGKSAQKGGRRTD